LYVLVFVGQAYEQMEFMGSRTGMRQRFGAVVCFYVPGRCMCAGIEKLTTIGAEKLTTPA